MPSLVEMAQHPTSQLVTWPLVKDNAFQSNVIYKVELNYDWVAPYYSRTASEENRGLIADTMMVYTGPMELQLPHSRMCHCCDLSSYFITEHNNNNHYYNN
jgi:hypothetical protein